MSSCWFACIAAEGLHLIDFEQLKIENQSLNEKIEERNEELVKLRKKTTVTVQVSRPDMFLATINVLTAALLTKQVVGLQVYHQWLRQSRHKIPGSKQRTSLMLPMQGQGRCIASLLSSCRTLHLLTADPDAHEGQACIH